MAYYFMVEEKRGHYKEIDLNNVCGFPGSKKYKKFGAYNLEEIDAFTMLFNDELELRRALVQSGRLNQELADKPLSVRWVTQTKKDKVMYDFLYQKDFDYVFEPYKLLQMILERYYSSEYGFILGIANHFINSYECANTASEINIHATDAMRLNIGNKYLETLDRNGDNLVTRMIKLLVFKHYIDYNSGYVSYSRDVNYRNLHEIIAYINHFDEKHGIVEPKKKITLDDILNPKNENVKKRVKSKDECDGQISIFDLFDDESY